jgi:hypothetical protein
MSAPAQALPGEQVHITTDPSTEPFWTAAQQDRHVAPKCADCGTFRLLKGASAVLRRLPQPADRSRVLRRRAA